MAASIRCAYRRLSAVSKSPAGGRLFGTKASNANSSIRPLTIGVTGLTVACATVYSHNRWYGPRKLSLISTSLIHTVSAARVPPQSQPSVYSQGKDHALYLWIHLKPNADTGGILKVATNLQKYVDMVTDPSMRDEMDEIWAGVGFGAKYYKALGRKPEKEFNYITRSGPLGNMPEEGGDLFIHAKCNTMSKLFELSQMILSEFPKDSVAKYEDVYSFVYRNGRDLSGFIDGTENPADDDDRRLVAVENGTGGSYVITQKWIHQMDVIANEKESGKESWVGRSLDDSTELKNKTVSSHVARMTGGESVQQNKVHQIVRQSMPFGTLHGGCGLFFIAYAASPENFNFMLDRMVGSAKDKQSDDIMRLSKNTKGTYWYFPGVEELAKLAGKHQ